ncbi:hypothetical protein TIFTF001_009645 [Ficus carica]|uniref:U3 small nucleolar RNA-associated protein 20 domain-containing protein n=1 Tax=Ficus carica TaxID=3494 RepID=A0AA88CZ49_FICCA|nr:hypothetical protein TIFTF001_009645 [Ficus carica]
MVSEIPACLRNVVLRKIQKLLDSDSDKANVNISLAALKHPRRSLIGFGCLLEGAGTRILAIRSRGSAGYIKRGHELHVLEYTLNFILSKILTTPVSGKIDYCLEVLLSVVGNDILGDVAKEKEVEKSITFKSHAPKVLSPVRSQLQKHLTKVVWKMNTGEESSENTATVFEFK